VGRRLIAALVVAGVLIVPSVALGSLTSDVQQGRRLAEEIRSGEKKCSELAADDFELIGEYAMSRYLGSTATHEAMNRHMTVMMGSVGEGRMHQALGYRYSGCPGGPAAGWVGPMGGMMSGRYEGSGGFGGGMMGGGYRGGMMGFGDSGDGDLSVLGVVLIALAAAAVGGALVFAGMRLGRTDR
jgi:hypothetical protein